MTSARDGPAPEPASGRRSEGRKPFPPLCCRSSTRCSRWRRPSWPRTPWSRFHAQTVEKLTYDIDGKTSAVRRDRQHQHQEAGHQRNDRSGRSHLLLSEANHHLPGQRRKADDRNHREHGNDAGNLRVVEIGLEHDSVAVVAPCMPRNIPMAASVAPHRGAVLQELPMALITLNFSRFSLTRISSSTRITVLRIMNWKAMKPRIPITRA